MDRSALIQLEAPTVNVAIFAKLLLGPRQRTTRPPESQYSKTPGVVDVKTANAVPSFFITTWALLVVSFLVAEGV